jgi:hypothetical protein
VFILDKRKGEYVTRRQNMRGMGSRVFVRQIVVLMLAGFFCILFSLPASADEGECRTGCPAGPKDYNRYATWSCQYYVARGSSDRFMSREKEIELSECILRVQGRFRDVEVANGRYKNFEDCFESFCVPKMTEICGVEDRCAEPKNWIKSRQRRFQ